MMPTLPPGGFRGPEVGSDTSLLPSIAKPIPPPPACQPEGVTSPALALPLLSASTGVCEV